MIPGASKMMKQSGEQIDNESFKKIDNFLNQYNRSKKNSFNKVTIRNFIKEFFQIYSG